ncbi:OmpH family outer membrane protein [Persephonella sp.]|uniref:OmpH family outer membrane protein n=1 Tax=Persephonella sp. TaxID=2060922 RepID=UPI002615320F|nr:OmpH family outer membrane protein [Persephonella sp.]
MKKLIFAFFLAISLTGFATAQNIAFVDVLKIMNTSKKGEEYKKELKAKIQYYKEKLDKIQKEIKELQKQLESPVLSPEAKKKKEEKLKQLKTEGIKLQIKAEQELQKIKAQAERKLVKDIQKIVEKYAKEHNIDIVLVGGTLYQDKAIDITDEILKLYDKGAK